MQPTEVRETRGRKSLAPHQKRGQASFTLPSTQVKEVFRLSEELEVPASRFVEFAIGVALQSATDPAYRQAVKEAAKKK